MRRKKHGSGEEPHGKRSAIPPGTNRGQIYVLAFTNEHGDAALRDLEAFFCNRPSYAPGETDLYQVAYREGEKSVIRFIRNQIRLGVDGMPKEAITREEDV